MKGVNTACVLLSLLVAVAVRADVYWIAEAFPASFFMNFENESLESTGEARTRESLATLTFYPHLGTGIGIEVGTLMLDLNAGAGILADSMFVSGTLYGDVALRWQAARAATVGPHVGVIHAFDPEWRGSLDVDISPTTGIIGGIQLTMGDKVSYLLSVDFLSMSFNAESGSPFYTLNTDSLDMKWVGFQFGLRGQF